MTQEQKSKKYWVKYLQSKYKIEPADIGHLHSDELTMEDIDRIAAKYDLIPLDDWYLGKAVTFMKRFRVKLDTVI